MTLLFPRELIAVYGCLEKESLSSVVWSVVNGACCSSRELPTHALS